MDEINPRLDYQQDPEQKIVERSLDDAVEKSGIEDQPAKQVGFTRPFSDSKLVDNL